MSNRVKKVPFWAPEHWLSVVLFFGVWELLPRLGGPGGLLEVFIAPPTQVLTVLIEMIREGELWGHVLVSLGRSAAGFAAASVLAIPLGFLLGSSFRTFERLVNLPLRFFAQLNPFSLFPLFILLLGIGELSKGTMIFWVCIWPILFNTINGVKGIDPLLVKSARSMGVGIITLFYKVIFPAALPGIFTGLKMGAGTAFFMLIAAEMIGASRGLGWLVWNAQTQFQMPRLFAATVVISILGLILQSLFVLFERKLLGWKESNVH